MVRKKSLAALCCLIALTVLSVSFTTGVLVTTQTVSSSGSISAIGVNLFWDSGCTNPVSAINWGSLVPGSIQEKTIYVKNSGNVDSTLNMATDNWIPTSTTSYMTLSWNRENYALTAGAVVSAKLTFTISPNIISGISNFSFDITIRGTST